MNITEKQLQLCLYKIQKWAMENGFRFSNSKAVGMHFCNKRGLHQDPEFKWYNSPIKIVPETKVLCILFYCKLTYLSHITMLKNKWLKEHVSSTDWDTDCVEYRLGYRYHGFITFKYIVDSIKIGLRMYRLRLRPSILYQVAWYSPLSRITTLTWSIQNVSSWENVCWNKRAFPWNQTYQTCYALCHQIESVSFNFCIRLCLNMKIFTINNPIQFNHLDSE